jgi:hypothetical protein
MYMQNPAFWVCFECMRCENIVSKKVYFFGFKDWKMLIKGKCIRDQPFNLKGGGALCATKKINILTLVLSEKKFLNETKKP